MPYCLYQDLVLRRFNEQQQENNANGGNKNKNIKK
jgi:hypothetical protein